MKARGVKPPTMPWTKARIEKRERTRRERHPPKLGDTRIHDTGGGRFYRLIRTPDGWRYEHRVVMENHLKRSLTGKEHVHHINRDRLDNRVENLQLMEHGEHSTHHHKGRPSPFRGVGSLLKGRWAKKYTQCVRCGKTDQPHAAKGVCRRCHRRSYEKRP